MIYKYLFLIVTFTSGFSLANSACSETPLNNVSQEQSCPPEFDGCSSYRYFSMGVGPIIIIPNVGLGYRSRTHSFGWDSSLSYSTVGYIHQLSTHMVGHYYLNPQHKNSSYLGLGLIGSAVIPNNGKVSGTLSPDFVFGRELKEVGKRNHFLEMHVAIPTMLVDSKRFDGTVLPLMYIKYGIGF